MNIARQHWEFKLRFNKLNSNHKEDMNPAKIDSLLNQAPIWIIQNYGQAFEKFQFLKDMFATLVVKYPEQEDLSVFNSTDNVYEFKMANLKYPYFHLVRAYAKCNDEIVKVSIIRHDETYKLTSHYSKPNYKWHRVLGEIGRSSDGDGQSLYVHSDVELTSLRVEYIKQPKEVFFGKYNTIEYVHCVRNNGANCEQYYSETDSPVDSEFPEQYHSFQVDVAVYLAAGKTENINLQQLLATNLIKL